MYLKPSSEERIFLKPNLLLLKKLLLVKKDTRRFLRTFLKPDKPEKAKKVTDG